MPMDTNESVHRLRLLLRVYSLICFMMIYASMEIWHSTWSHLGDEAIAEMVVSGHTSFHEYNPEEARTDSHYPSCLFLHRAKIVSRVLELKSSKSKGAIFSPSAYEAGEREYPDSFPARLRYCQYLPALIMLSNDVAHTRAGSPVSHVALSLEQVPGPVDREVVLLKFS